LPPVGFERIVELRLKPVSEAQLVLDNAEADLKKFEPCLSG
jgi:hypothetical protein